MTNNTHRVTIDLTYAPDDALSDIHTANYAAQLRDTLALGDKATATVKVEKDINAERIVRFTPTEVTELADFLRTFEASPKAVDLLHRISMRSINAVANIEDADDEPYDASKKFSNVRSYPGMSGLSVISTDEPTA